MNEIFPVSVSKSALSKTNKIIDEGVTLLLIASGSADVYMDGKIYKAGYGDAFLILPGEFAYILSKNAIAYKLVFDYSILSGESLRLALALKHRRIALKEEDFLLFVDYISCITAVAKKTSPDYKKVLDKLFYALVIEFSGKQSLNSTVDESPFGKICYFATEEPYENQKLTDVAFYAGLTTTYLCSLFKSKTGVSYNKYVKRKRLRDAELLLLLGNQAKDVAETCKYQSFSHFMSDFKEFLSLTPNAYKKLHE